MKNFRYVEPLATRLNIRQSLLHRIHDRPPPLCLGIRSHLAHISLVVAAMVFEVRNEKAVVKVNGIVADVAGLNRGEDRRPNLLVVFDVLLATFRTKPDQLAVTTHKSLQLKFKTACNAKSAIDIPRRQSLPFDIVCIVKATCLRQPSFLIDSPLRCPSREPLFHTQS